MLQCCVIDKPTARPTYSLSTVCIAGTHAVIVSDLQLARCFRFIFFFQFSWSLSSHHSHVVVTRSTGSDYNHMQMCSKTNRASFFFQMRTLSSAARGQRGGGRGRASRPTWPSAASVARRARRRAASQGGPRRRGDAARDYREERPVSLYKLSS